MRNIETRSGEKMKKKTFTGSPFQDSFGSSHRFRLVDFGANLLASFHEEGHILQWKLSEFPGGGGGVVAASRWLLLKPKNASLVKKFQKRELRTRLMLVYV